MYHQWAELGVFRYPTAEMPEVAACCARGKIYREAKRRLIEESLHVWTLFGDDLAEPLCFLLRKLLEDRSRQTSSRLEFWRMKWEVCKKQHDKDVELLMNGIVCVTKQDLRGALKHFERYCQGLAEARPLVEELTRLLSDVGGDMGEARRKDMAVRGHKATRQEFDHRQT